MHVNCIINRQQRRNDHDLIRPLVTNLVTVAAPGTRKAPEPVRFGGLSGGSGGRI
jgi:hypothetical protein